MSLLGIATFATVGAAAANAATTPTVARAMWVWDTSTPQATVDFAAAKGISQLYAAVPPRVGTSPQLAQLRELSQRAAAAGIRVDALGGDPTWIDNDAAGGRHPVLAERDPGERLHPGPGGHPQDERCHRDGLPQPGGRPGRDHPPRERGGEPGAALGRPVRIGQETNYLGSDPTEVKQTFYGQTQSQMEVQLAAIVQAYSTSAAFTGLAIHDSLGYAAMLP
jgi:hypothetical protein